MDGSVNDGLFVLTRPAVARRAGAALTADSGLSGDGRAAGSINARP